jgi:hypothetical protein
MKRTVLEESWRRNGPVGPSLEVTDDDPCFKFCFYRFGFYLDFLYQRIKWKIVMFMLTVP